MSSISILWALVIVIFIHNVLMAVEISRLRFSLIKTDELLLELVEAIQKAIERQEKKK